jgi:hypothetical protein
MDLLGGEDMIKVMVVYDEDPLYAGRLAEYVNQKETFPFQAMAFSDLEKLKAYGRDHEIAILLVGERVREEAKEIKAGLKMLPPVTQTPRHRRKPRFISFSPVTVSYRK